MLYVYDVYAACGRRRIPGALGFALVFALVTGLAAAAPGGAVAAVPEGVRLGPELERRLAEGLVPATGVAVGVTLREGALPPAGRRSPADVAALRAEVLGALPAGSFSLSRRYRRLAGFAGRATPGALRALARHPRVATVYLDGELHALLREGARLVGARDASAEGYSGKGVTVAVIDSGVDTDHPDLADDLVAEQCFCDDHPSPSRGCCPDGSSAQSGPGSAEDDSGHGTAVAGIVTSRGRKAPAGVAPRASLVAVKSLGAGEGGSFSSFAAGLDWLLDRRDALDLRVVNLSVGDGGAYDDPRALPCSGTNTANAIAALHAAGVAVFVSSGNEGHDHGISFPACVDAAVSVGGVYDADVGSVSWCADADCSATLCTDSATGPDTFACHTSSGTLLDLLAPDYATVTSRLGGGTTLFAGTSAAAPYAAGQAAQLLDADPTVTPAELRALLARNGPLVTNPDSGLAFPRSDVSFAIAQRLGIACGNGLDDDGDGLVDAGADPGCRHALWEIEDPACEDGADNDGDGFVDWDGGGAGAPDPECDGRSWWKFESSSTSCGLGFELALLLPLLQALRGLRAARGLRGGGCGRARRG